MCAPASRAFSRTAIASGSPPFSFWSCAAQRGAGAPTWPGRAPPPTIRTSTFEGSRGSRSSVARTHWDLTEPQPADHAPADDLEQVADDAVVGDFEDRRFGVLVDGDDRARRPSCRRRAGWRRRCRARRTASARRSGRSCRSGDPSAASRRRRSDARPRARRRAPPRAARRREVLLPLDAAADRHDPLGLRQIDRLLALPGTAPPASGESRAASTVTTDVRTGAAARAARWPASARNAPICSVTRCGAGPCGTTSAVSLPWNIGRTKSAVAVLRLDRGDVGDERPVDARGERRREVARLVGVREEHERGLRPAR